jgi:hypothetical protein
MSKMRSHDPFGQLKHKLWPKEGRESNWQFDFQPLKVRNRPNFLAHVACDISLKKLLMKATTLLQTSSQSEVYTQSYEPPKSWKSQLWKFRNSHFGVPGQNDIWVLVPWLGTKYTIRGKVVASPKSRPWWVLWILVCPWLVRAPKCFNYALTNLLFGLCRLAWVSKLLVNLPSPIPELQNAPLPP